MAFGDTPNHGKDLCATCSRFTEIKGHAERELIRSCGALESEVRIPARVTSCTLYHKRTDPTLRAMYDMAWVLTLNQKKREVGFQPPKKQPEWVTEVSEMVVEGDDE